MSECIHGQPLYGACILCNERGFELAPEPTATTSAIDPTVQARIAELKSELGAAIEHRLSAQPSPDAAQSNAEIAARKECETLLWQPDVVSPKQVKDLLQQFQFIERELDVPKQLIAAARYAIEHLQSRIRLLRGEADAAQGGEHGGEVQQDSIVSALRERMKHNPFSNSLIADGWLAGIESAIEVAKSWDRQNRAPQPVQEPEPVYFYRGRPISSTTWDSWKECSKESAEQYMRDGAPIGWQFEVKTLYTSPQPVQGGDEGVDALAILDAAYKQEIARVSHVQFDSREMCEHFYNMIRGRIVSRLASK